MSKYIKPEELLESMRDCYQKKIDVLAERHKKALAQIDEMALQLSRYEEKNYVILPIDAYGKPIHVGDKVFWYAVGYFDVIGIGEQVVLDKGDSRFAIVPSDVLEVVATRFSDAFVAMPTDEIKTKIMLPKIVRCEDCANSSFDEFGVGWCSENCREVKPCDYCVWGDRK